MPIRLLLPCLTLILAVATATLAATRGGELVRPIALAVDGQGRILILHRYGGIYRADPRLGRLSTVRPSLGPWQPLDMALANVGGRDALFVTQRWPVRKDGELFRLARYDAASGEETGAWTAAMPYTVGVAVSSAGRGAVAYLAASSEREVARLDLANRSATPQRVLRLWQAKRLSALAFDEERDRLWVADDGGGELTSFGTDGEVARTVEGLALPVALVVDAPRRRLLVLDNADERVLSVDLGRESSRPEVLIDLDDDVDADDPLGLAVDSTGTIWVGDADEGLLLSFDAEGRFLRWMRLRAPAR